MQVTSKDYRAQCRHSLYAWIPTGTTRVQLYLYTTSLNVDAQTLNPKPVTYDCGRGASLLRRAESSSHCHVFNLNLNLNLANPLSPVDSSTNQLKASSPPSGTTISITILFQRDNSSASQVSTRWASEYSMSSAM